MTAITQEARVPGDNGHALAGDIDAVFADLDARRVLQMVAGYAMVVDARGRIRWMSRVPPDRPPDELIDSDLFGQIVEDQRQMLSETFERVLAEGGSAALDLRGSSTGRWYSVRLSRIEWRNSALGVLVHAVDIEDAKRDRAAFAVERARLEASTPGAAPRFEVIADALPVLISYVDRERRYQYNNAVYADWFETSLEQLRGREMSEVLGAKVYEQIRSYVDAALSGQSVRFERVIPYRGLEPRRVVARYVPDVQADGEVAGFYALIEDVSAQREAEAALLQREEQLRQVMKMEALGRLAGGIAHEFGNLLMTVITGCTAVSEALGDDSPLHTMIAQVKRAAQRGSSLTRQLLAFSSTGESTSGPVEIDAVVGDVVVLLDRLMGSRIELEVDLGADVWVNADAGQIQQVLMNLAINARDAMPEGGRLQVVTARAELDASEAAAHNLAAGTYAVLNVLDTGIGMDATTQTRIFDPFFTTKPPGQGTGLGLSTVFGIVRHAGGEIEVESAPGVGSVFRLYFPVRAPESELEFRRA